MEIMFESEAVNLKFDKFGILSIFTKLLQVR